MATYDSHSSEQPGQYPTSAWHLMGLPEQNQGSGAGGSSPPSQAVDAGHTNEPGQYPGREPFMGGPLGGSGAPGGVGAGRPAAGGPDEVTYSRPTFYKSMYDQGGMDQGAVTETAHDTVSGKGDWTQANDQGYQADAELQLVGIAGNTPGGTGAGSGRVLHGGFVKGQR